ncbi:MAG: cobalamin biosynthesis protein CobQ [Silicimonas sp.]|nr:cobalamin biosynthesis protein CobQ [Silicimonas sp.]
MNTPAHLIFGTAVFGKRTPRGAYWAALAGAFAPDFSLYAMVAVSIWVMGTPAQIVFDQYYYSDAWQAVFAVDNSFILWGAIFALAAWRKMPIIIAFSGAGLLHLALDFPLHTHDARMHFWPLTDWVFVSPFSYWDNSAHAGIIGPLALFGSALLAFVLWQRFDQLKIRLITLLLLMAELFSSGIWRFVF